MAADFESQNEDPKSWWQKLKIPIIIGSVVAIVGGVVGICWGLGVFDSDDEDKQQSQQQQQQQQQRLPLKITDINLGAGKTIADLTEDQVEAILNTPETSVPADKKALWTQVKENHSFAQNLTEAMEVNAEECAKIILAQANKTKYTLTPAQQNVIDNLVKKCQTSGHIQKPDSNSTNQPDPPKSNQPGGSGDPNSPINNNNQPTVSDFTQMKTFLALAEGERTLAKLLETGPNRAALLAQFNALNVLDDSGRTTKLGTAELNTAFLGILQAHIDKAATVPASLDVVRLANDKASELSLTLVQKIAIAALLARKLQTPADFAKEIIEKHGKGESLPDLSVLSATDKEEVKKQLLVVIHNVAKKIESTTEKLTGHTLIELLQKQRAALAAFPDIKLAAADVHALEDAQATRFGTLINAAQNAVAANGGKAATYRTVYEVYSKATGPDKENIGADLIDGMCARAIREQVTSTSTNFADDSYQAVCLALNAHILLRGSLKRNGVVCACLGTENSTNWTLPSKLDFFSYCPEDKMKAFVAAIDADKKSMVDKLKQGAVKNHADIDLYITFIEDVKSFVKLLQEFFHVRNPSDSRLQQLRDAFGKLDDWKQECELRKQLLDTANAAFDPPNDSFVKAVMGGKMSEVVRHLPGVDKAVPNFINIIEELQKCAVLGTGDATSHAYLSKSTPFDAIKAYLNVKSKISNDDVKKSFNALTVSFDDTNFLFIVESSDEFAALTLALENANSIELNTAIIELGSKLTDQYVHFDNARKAKTGNASVTSTVKDLFKWVTSGGSGSDAQHAHNYKNAQKMAKIAKQVQFTKSLSSNSAAYVVKIHEAATTALNLVSDKTDKAYITKNYFTVSGDGKVKLLFNSSYDLLPFMVMDSPDNVKKAFAKLYALYHAFDDPTSIDLAGAVDVDVAITTFLANCKEYAEARFAVDFIEKSRKPDGGIGCSNLPSSKWDHKSIAFKPLQRLAKTVENEMVDYVKAGNCPSKPSAPLTEKEDDSYPKWKKQKIEEAKKADFTLLRTNLINAVVKDVYRA